MLKPQLFEQLLKQTMKQHTKVLRSIKGELKSMHSTTNFIRNVGQCPTYGRPAEHRWWRPVFNAVKKVWLTVDDHY